MRGTIQKWLGARFKHLPLLWAQQRIAGADIASEPFDDNFVEAPWSIFEAREVA